MPDGFWTNYDKAWTDFQEANTTYPLLNICYEDMKKVKYLNMMIIDWQALVSCLNGAQYVVMEKRLFALDFDLPVSESFLVRMTSSKPLADLYLSFPNIK